MAAALKVGSHNAQSLSTALQADLRGLERAFDQTLPPPPPGGRGEGRGSSSGAGEVRSSSGSTGLARQETPPDPRRALMRDRRREAWKRLTVVERDAVIVLSAMCKVGAGAGVVVQLCDCWHGRCALGTSHKLTGGG